MNLLVLIDGSPEAFLASEFAISLAAARHDDVIAQAMIDSDTALRLTGYRGYAGLCGSGVFLSAYEQIVAILRSVCDTLVMSFTTRAEGRGLRVKSFVDTGNAETVLRDRIAEQHCVLVLPGTNSNQSLVSSFKFGCPIIVVMKPRGNSTEIAIVANDEWTEQLLTEIGQAFPDAPPIHLNNQDFRTGSTISAAA